MAIYNILSTLSRTFVTIFLCHLLRWNAQVQCIAKPLTCSSSINVDLGKGTVKFPPIVVPTPTPKINTKFDAKGLQPFYNLANSFMNTVQNDPPPKLSTDFFTKFQNDEAFKKKIVSYELPILIAVGIGLLFTLLFPLVGLCFCCCRLANNCGGEMIQKGEDSENHAKCCICSFILFILTLFLLCGVLFMYVTNNRVHTAVDSTKQKYLDGVDEAFSFMNTTLRELQALNDQQLPCAVDLIRSDVSDAGVKEYLGKPIQTAVSPYVLPAINSVLAATENVTAMRNSLSALMNGTKELQTLTDKLSMELKSAKDELDSILSDCADTPAKAKCSSMSSSGLQLEANYSSLPNVEKELDSLQKILDGNFSGAAQEGKKIFDDVPDTVVDKAQGALKDIRQLINDGTNSVNTTVVDYVNRVSKILDDRKTAQKYSENVDDVNKFEKYRWYGFIGAASLMAFITLLLAVGLTCGICAYKRGDFPTHRSNISHHGGNCLMAAVGFMFIFSFVFFLLTTIFFAVGIHLHIGCREIENGNLVDQYYTFKINGTIFGFEQLLSSCRSGSSAFQAIGGNKIINIDEKLNITKQLGDIDGELNKIRNQVNLSDVQILNSDTRKSLDDLSQTSVQNISFQAFLDEFQKQVVKADLTELAGNLTSLANELRSYNNENATRLANRTTALANNLTNIQDTTVQMIKAKVNSLAKDVNDVKSKSLDLQNVAKKILSELVTADNYVKTSSANDVFNVVKKFKDRVVGWADQYARHVINEVKNELGKCGPVANIFDGIVNVFLCKELIGNFNGFWLSMGWCMFFFPFLVIFAVHLAKYFRRMKFLDGFDNPSRPPPYNDHKGNIPMTDYDRPPPYNRYHNESYSQH